MAEYELLYFPIRGRGEQVRLLFTLAGVAFTDTGVTDWPARKATTPTGQLPVLVDRSEGSEFQIPQSPAIMRHLARRFEMYGANAREKTMSDYIADSAQDWRNKFAPVAYPQFFGTTPEAIEQYWKALPDTLALFEKLLGQSTKPEAGFFVGDKPTFADVMVFDLLDGHLSFKPESLDGYPGLKAFVGRFRELPRIAEFIAGRNRP